ncbi:hypothetical protein F4780DRAFT_729943 [Xylariomycetidae sp. FL0641]|nr:hypothetical protein F4780DRAFT_729943 [Xylariomycetidae sp. FL0641]
MSCCTLLSNHEGKPDLEPRSRTHRRTWDEQLPTRFLQVVTGDSFPSSILWVRLLLLCPGNISAATMAPKRIDVHHHFLPPNYVHALKEAGGDPSGWTIPKWTAKGDVQFNEQEDISFTFLSITAPGSGILGRGDAQAEFCRFANQYAAAMRRDHPGRYGFFASVPSLLDAGAAQREIAYALDELGADGVVLYTRYGPGNRYLGHPDFAGTWDLLDARGAVVFVHPTHPADTALVSAALPQPMIDYPHETTRAAVDLITSGTVRAHPRVKVILSHAGGTLPYLALRPAAMLPFVPAAEARRFSHDTDGSPVPLETAVAGFLADAKSFYFDTALSAEPGQLDLLRRFARPGHVLFGSDYPYAPTPAIKYMNGLLDEYKSRDADFVSEVEHGAALKLFPHLAEVFGAEEQA